MKNIVLFILILCISCRGEDLSFDVGGKSILLSSIDKVIIYYEHWTTATTIRQSKEVIREYGPIRAVFKKKKHIMQLLEQLKFNDKRTVGINTRDHRVVIDIILENDEVITIGMDSAYYYVQGYNYSYRNSKELREYITNLVEDHMTWIDPVFEKMRKRK